MRSIVIRMVLSMLALLAVSMFLHSALWANASDAPDGVVLNQNYPNPFTNRTEIGYSIPSHGRVLLRVYNTLGQEIQTLVDELEPEGKYTARFDATSYPSGQYTYTMVYTPDEGGSSKLIKKMYLVR